LIDAPPMSEGEGERRRRARRNAIILGIVALAFYASFIVMSVMRAHR
jgi:hypothetical protein